MTARRLLRVTARPCDDGRHRGFCRHCAVCNAKLDYRRYSRVTCSDRCRQHLHRDRAAVAAAVAATPAAAPALTCTSSCCAVAAP